MTTLGAEFYAEVLKKYKVVAGTAAAHQVERVGRRIAHLKVAPERCYHNIDRYGNLSAGAIPALLDEVNRAGMLGPGDLCCMAGFGSGFTWGSALLRW